MRIRSTFSRVLILWISTYCGKYRVSAKIVCSMGIHAKGYTNTGKRTKESKSL